MRECGTTRPREALASRGRSSFPHSLITSFPLQIPTPRQERTEHSRAQRRVRDPQLLRRAEEEPRLETEIDPVRRAEALRDPESRYARRQSDLAGHVSIRRHVAAAFDERTAHPSRLSV